MRSLDDEEAGLFRLLEAVTQHSAATLNSRWREPSLTIHSVRGLGPHNSTVIPASVTAQVSLRIVPDQVLDSVCAALVQHLRASFDALSSANTIKVMIPSLESQWRSSHLTNYDCDIGDGRPYGRLVARRSDAPVVPRARTLHS